MYVLRFLIQVKIGSIYLGVQSKVEAADSNFQEFLEFDLLF